MYRLLIVDDEIHAVHGIKQGIQWDKLNISEVHVAYNIRQAKEILSRCNIDIMICDIEMPKGNGLELLKWIREQNTQVESIFLTCHAEFQYAQQAVQLGSLEYMLKPVRFKELEDVLHKAVSKIQKARELTSFNETIQNYSELWSMHKPLLIERFWLDLINQSIPSELGAIQDIISRQDIPYTVNMQFSMVLITIREWRKELQSRDEKIMEYALRNSAEHMFQKDGKLSQVIPIRKGMLLVFIPNNEADSETRESIETKCVSYIDSCNQYFYCDLCCYIGATISLEQVAKMVECLSDMDINNVNGSNRVYYAGKSQGEELPIIMPDLNEWSNLLKQGAKGVLLSEIRSYFEEMVHSEGLNAQSLHIFYQDFMQMVYYILKLQGLQAHRIFADKEFQSIAAEATRSVNHLHFWTKQMMETALEHMHNAKETGTVVERVKQYISEHIGQDLTREEVAGHFYLNVDYLSRIFKKETGQLLSDYFLGERIRLSKVLLSKTDLPISTIAVTVGYSNFSHFSKIFKRETEIAPQEYRKNYKL